MEVSGQHPAPATLNLGTSPWYWLESRLGRPQLCLHTMEKRNILHCWELNLATAVCSPSLYRLSYPSPSWYDIYYHYYYCHHLSSVITLNKKAESLEVIWQSTLWWTLAAPLLDALQNCIRPDTWPETKVLKKIGMSTQLRKILYTGSKDMLVLSSTVASRYCNCCRVGSISPVNYGYQLAC
jgi:hypothetical protein